tara:strand:- start:22 stop:1239 length:1218 start_codon:yes stop_codon:yes gene_type:complete
MANKVKFKRGANSGYASMLSAAGSVEGEPHWITDTYSMYVATGTTTSKWVGAEILDEDTLNSDSATKLATQQSIKAYVDAQVTAQDLDISADSGSNIAIDLDSEVLAVSGGEGIDTSITGNAITITGEEASASNKGVASFSSDNFLVSSGVVTVKDGGVANDELANSAITVTAGDGLKTGGSVSLGGTVTVDVDVSDFAGVGLVDDGSENLDLSLNEVSAATVDVANDSIAIIDANASNATKKEAIADLIGAIDGTGLTATAGVLSVDAAQAITSVTGNFTVDGNLIVSGTSVTTNVATVEVEDPMIKLAHGNTGSDALDIGFYGTYEDVANTPEYTGLIRDASDGDGVFILFDSLTTEPSTGTVTVGSNNFAYAALKCADITGIDDDGTGNAELSGFNVDGGTW